MTELYVIISAQNCGAIAPILSWQKRPDCQIWTTYFKTSPTPANPVPEAAPKNLPLRD